jgi:hypothetical protein
MKNPIQILHGVFRILKKGGQAVILCPLYDDQLNGLLHTPAGK